MSIKRVAAGVAVAAIATGVAVTACEQRHYDPCWDNPCDEYGHVLVFAPYFVPAFGIYGRPGYRPPQWIQPGQSGYRPSFQGKPPNYNPPKPVAPPAPGQTKPALATPRTTATASKPASQSKSTQQSKSSAPTVRKSK